MDTGAAKGIELILIIAVVLGFYLQQTRALDRARNQDTKPDSEDETPKD